MASYSNTNYTNDYFDTTGYFNPTSQSSSSIDIEDLDKRFLQKSGGTISNNLLVNGSVDIQTSHTIKFFQIIKYHTIFNGVIFKY